MFVLLFIAAELFLFAFLSFLSLAFKVVYASAKFLKRWPSWAHLFC